MGHKPSEHPEEHPGAENRGDHEDKEHPVQIGRQHYKVCGSCRKLEKDYDNARDADCDKICDYPYVFFKTIDRISRKKAFAAVPTALHHMSEKTEPEDILRFNLRISIPPAGKNDGCHLKQQDAGEDYNTLLERGRALPSSYVYQMFAGPDERKGCRNAHDPDCNAHGHAPPYW